MCGIAGIYSLKNKPIDSSDVKKMTNSIAHRGPDGEGLWNDDSTICLGHRRLSIIDLSIEANQPFHLKDRYTIVYNGEIYNYLELKDNLIQEGYTFTTNSDTEVLIALYDLKKEKALTDLDGMFAFAIWDQKEQELFCARDRFGEKPFFFTQQNDAFYFASEIKAFWACGLTKKPNSNRVFQYLAYDLIYDLNEPEATFFENISQLKPAHYFKIKKGVINTQTRYWEIDLTHKNTTISYNDATKEFKRLFDLSIKRRLRSDVPVGSSLSGGLDSSSIVSSIQKNKNTNQKQSTFSARFEGFKKDEGKYIDIVSKEYNTDSHNIFITEESQNEFFEKVCYHQDEPFGSSSITAQYQVMKLAKEHNVTVLLDGQGADEYLAGYNRFFDNYLYSLYKKNKKVYFEKKKAFERFYATKFSVNKFNYSNEINSIRLVRNKLLKPQYLKQFTPQFLLKSKNFKYVTTFAPTLNHALYDSVFSKSLPTLLRYADRNAMANSREVRLPFLFHELVEFVFSLPDNYKIRDCWTKSILRNSMKKELPEVICWRKDKVGFEPPNNRMMDEITVKKSIQILVDKNILNAGQVLENKHWDYVQIAKLYE